MRVLFVALGAENLAFSLLAPLLEKAGHTVDLAFSASLFNDQVISLPTISRLFNDDHSIHDKAREFRPDVVCFSAFSMNHRRLLKIAGSLRESTGAKTIFGGIHPSAVPELVVREPAVDYVCVGEGETALPMLLERLGRGALSAPSPNILFKSPTGEILRGPQLPLHEDLDSLPGFEKDIWRDYLRLDKCYMTISSRGCPIRCTFCANDLLSSLDGRKSPHFRQRSAEHFLNELKTAKRKYGITFVNIEDDAFTLDAGWLRKFSDSYRREIGVPFACLSHPLFLDEERIRLLKEAGCVSVDIGVQSVDESVRKKWLNRPEKNWHIERAVQLLEEARIPYVLDHMLGIPSETPESQERAWQFYGKLNPSRINTFWLTYYPGTEIQRIALTDKYLTAEEADKINRGHLGPYYGVDVKLPAPVRRLYRSYLLLLHLSPLLPRWIKRKIGAARIANLPEGALKTLDFLAQWICFHRHPTADYRRYAAQFWNNFRIFWRRKGG